MTDGTFRQTIAGTVLGVLHLEGPKYRTGKVSGGHMADEIADTVLAVLADLPESVIERAAEGLHDAAFGQELPEAPIDLARAAFRAAFGGEQK